MARLIWSPRAARDFHNICEYIARDSRRAARKFGRRLLQVIESIPDQPRLGSIVPEYERDDIREHILGDYRIVYRLANKRIEIVAISHGARLLPPSPPE
jgi:plasmid stabilization system protein ParE